MPLLAIQDSLVGLVYFGSSDHCSHVFLRIAIMPTPTGFIRIIFGSTSHLLSLNAA